MSVVLGVDIGGSHITAALVDLDSRSVVAGSKLRRLVNSQGEANKIINEWLEVLNEIIENYSGSVCKVGIAMPGPFDYEEGISLMNEQDKFKHLYQLNIKNIIAAKLHLIKENIKFKNDAACFLQGEVFSGAARGYVHVAGLTLGTGLGAAVCSQNNAEDANLWNYPFLDGIAEDYLSTRWFIRRYREKCGRSITGVKELLEKEDSSSLVKVIFSEFGENMAAFLLPFIERNKIRMVVFGGNISNAFGLFLPALNSKLINTPVVVKKGLLNEDASLIGAASTWKNFSQHERIEMH